MGRKKKDGRSLGNHRVYKTESQKNKALSEKRYAWSKEHRTAFTLRLNNETQKDVIDFLKTVPNKQEFIVNLIREHLNK